jgi:hypothetical protein
MSRANSLKKAIRQIIEQTEKGGFQLLVWQKCALRFVKSTTFLEGTLVDHWYLATEN